MVQARRATARTLLVIGTTAGLVLAGAAGAAVSDDVTDADPSAGETQYPPEEKPTITVDVEALCPGGEAVLDYAATVTGTDATTTTLTWDLPTGDVVMTDRPLSGRVPWPNPVVGSTVDVTFAIDSVAEVTVPVTFPSDCIPATPVSNPSPTVPTAGDLPRTGVEALPLLAAALGLVLVGTAAVTLAVRRRRAGSDE